MRTIFLFLFCLSAYAAPLPPYPVVKRPPVLKSPKAASIPKSAIMLKVLTTTGPATIEIELTWNLNFFGCNTNDPGCVLYDLTHVSAVQKAGKAVEIQFADQVNPPGWVMAGSFSPPTEDRIVELSWFLPNYQRPMQRYFRVVEVPYPSGFQPASIGVNQNLTGITTATRKPK